MLQHLLFLAGVAAVNRSNVSHLRDLACSSETMILPKDQINSTQKLLQTIERGSVSFGIRSMVESKSIDEMNIILSSLVTSAPWIVLFLLTGLLWVYLTYKCIQNKTKQASSYWVLVIALLFTLLVCGFSIAGLYQSRNMGLAIDAIRCQIMDSLDSLINGQPGLMGLLGSLDLIAHNTTIFLGQVSTYFANTSRSKMLLEQEKDLLDAIDSMSQRNINPVMLQTQGRESYYSQGQVLNFMIGKANYFLIQPQLADHLYEMGINPEKQLAEEFYGTLLFTINQIDKSLDPLFDERKYQLMVNHALKQCHLIAADVIAQCHQVYSQTAPLNFVATQITMFFQVFFALGLSFTGIIWLGFVYRVVFSIERAKLFIHCGWIFYLILTLLGFGVTCILHPAVVILSQSCIYADELLTQKQTYLDSNLIEDVQIERVVEGCLFSDGKVLKILGYQSDVDLIGSLSRNLSSLNLTAKAKHGNRTYITNILQNNSLILQALQDGTILDQDPDTVSKHNVEALLIDFNSFSSDKGCVEISQLRNSCRDGSTPLRKIHKNSYSGQVDPGRGSMFSHQLLKKQERTCWHPTLLTHDLSGICPQQQQLGHKLKEWFISQRMGWNPILKQQLLAASKNNVLASSLWNQVDNTLRFQEVVLEFVNQVTDPANPYVSDLKCSVLRSALEDIKQVVCTELLVQTVQSMILVLGMSILMLFGSVPIMLATRQLDLRRVGPKV